MCPVHSGACEAFPWDVWNSEHIQDWGSACTAALTRGAAAIPGRFGLIRQCGAGVAQPAGAWVCLWAEGMKYSMKIRLSPWLGSNSA